MRAAAGRGLRPSQDDGCGRRGLICALAHRVLSALLAETYTS